MGREEFELLQSGAIKRKVKRRVGLFVNGVGLDRATRRLERKVDIGRLVSGLTSGIEVEVARYYTLVPYEDDARQLAFLDAISRAGLEVVTKRLPPKGVKRQVSMDVHMATDLISYSYGLFANKKKANTNGQDAVVNGDAPTPASKPVKDDPNVKRIANVVCPSREMAYSIYVSNEFGVETSLADFGLYGHSDGWMGVDRWVDLSTSETIWR